MDSFNERIISPGQGIRNVASVKIYISLSSGQNHHEIILYEPFSLVKNINWKPENDWSSTSFFSINEDQSESLAKMGRIFKIHFRPSHTKP